jgi:hypothetical protein
MRVYLSCTANLGDFLNSFPVLSGLHKQYGKFDFVIKDGLKKFRGIKEFLVNQDMFSSVEFDTDVFMYGNVINLSSWTREDQNNPNRPIETCRYENWLRDNYPNLQFEVDDDVQILVPEMDIEIEDTYYCGDRWDAPDIDTRRKSSVLAHLNEFKFLSYENSLSTNAYIIKNLKKPFITNFTGVAVLADLLNVPSYVVWKAEDWNPEFRKGDNCYWDNGKDINKVFQKHFYGNRKSKLVHNDELESLL